MAESPESAAIPAPSPTEHREPRLVVCIGASAGGLEALEAFFAALPARTDIAWVVVVHLSPHFKSLMPELIGRRTVMRVRAAQDGDRLEADEVFIIPPSQNLTAREGRLELAAQDRERGHGLHLPIDICLRSMAAELGPRCVSVILSGTGSDGSRGARLVKDRGGVVFVQSPDEARFDGMPLSAIQTGVVDLVAPVAELAERTIHLVQNAQLLLHRAPADPDDASPEDRFLEGPEQIDEVLKQLEEGGFDLSYMRSSTLHRRVKRRAALQGCADPAAYLERLKASPEEVETLAHDLLVGVTSFFRDPEVFEALRRKVFPDLVRRSTESEPIRIWIPGCSTGQEVYTVGMCLLEALDAAGLKRDFRIFATDLNGEALKHASRGEYTVSELQDVPKTLGTRYVEYRAGALSVNATLRRSVLFALHNLVKDPPFTRIDFLSCRNLIIYLKPDARQKVMNSLLTALKPDTGVLLLGKAESISAAERHFEEIDTNHKLYRRTDRVAPVNIASSVALVDPVRSVVSAEPLGRRSYAELRAAQDAKMLRVVLETSFEGERRSAALIDQGNRLLEVITDPQGIFRLRKGRPSDDLALLLTGPFSAALLSARSRLAEDADAPARVMVMDAKGAHPRHELILQQISVPGASSRSYLLSVRELESLHPESEGVTDEEHSDQVSNLMVELSRTKERLNATIEQLQSTNEEQQSTNEELIASNEELQSTNEELQSLNEELYTVNVEFQRKNEELQVVNADLDNLLTHLTVATLFLDRELLIRKFNPSITRVVTLQPRDVGRRINDFAPRIEVDLQGVAETVLASGQLIEEEFLDRDGSWLQMRAHPYIGPHGQETGVLMTFVDVSRIKAAEENARSVSERLTSSNERLTTQSRQLEELFSMVTHDLRRPLLALDGMLSLAGEALSEGRNPSTFLERSRARVGSLRSVVGDLSYFVRLNHDHPALETWDLGPWLEEAVAPYVPRAAERGVRLQVVSEGLEARFAASLASRVVRNLLDNALTHGASAEEPRVEVRAQTDAGHLHLEVEDNGAGVAPEYHDRIFELFRRLDPESSEGTGVGLTAVRRMVERVGGSVSLSSDVGAGARFTVRIPLRDPDEIDVPLMPERTLLATRDREMVESVGRALPQGWLHVDPNETSLGPLLQDGVQILLLDPGFPDGHGLDLLPWIREQATGSLPIILVSEALEGLDIAEFEEFNVRGYVDLRTAGSLARLGELMRSVLKDTT